MTDKSEWVLVPRRITPEIARALEENFAPCEPASAVHAANWQEAWESALSARPTPPDDLVEDMAWEIDDGAFGIRCHADGTISRFTVDGQRVSAAKAKARRILALIQKEGER